MCFGLTAIPAGEADGGVVTNCDKCVMLDATRSSDCGLFIGFHFLVRLIVQIRCVGDMLTACVGDMLTADFSFDIPNLFNNSDAHQNIAGSIAECPCTGAVEAHALRIANPWALLAN